MEIIYFVLFIIIGGISILSALGAVIAPRIIYSLISLVALFFSTGALFFLLNADLAGIVQLLVYGIGVTILIIFAIMFTSHELDKKLWIAFAPRTLFAIGAIGIIFLLTIFGFTSELKDFRGQSSFKIKPPEKSTIIELETNGTTKMIGKSLLTKYVMPFELLSVLLLAAIAGAGVLAVKNDESEVN